LIRKEGRDGRRATPRASLNIEQLQEPL
jgi:hypothetical protein